VTGATPMTADRFVGQLYQEIKTTRWPRSAVVPLAWKARATCTGAA